MPRKSTIMARMNRDRVGWAGFTDLRHAAADGRLPVPSQRFSLAQWFALKDIERHEAAGYAGAPAEVIPPRTRAALHRKGWIEPTVDGSRRLTVAGRTALRQWREGQ